jgi:hypothetical protein
MCQEVQGVASGPRTPAYAGDPGGRPDFDAGCGQVSVASGNQKRCSASCTQNPAGCVLPVDLGEAQPHVSRGSAHEDQHTAQAQRTLFTHVVASGRSNGRTPKGPKGPTPFRETCPAASESFDQTPINTYPNQAVKAVERLNSAVCTHPRSQASTNESSVRDINRPKTSRCSSRAVRSKSASNRAVPLKPNRLNRAWSADVEEIIGIFRPPRVARCSHRSNSSTGEATECGGGASTIPRGLST